ncbi:MAG TPA: hypothetical protein VM618_11675, partial [Acidimicrobiia bacterium]|nr:hypothetical protein [Acidimicrobiia bacterium]
SLADPDRVNAVLGDAGFIDIALEGVEAPMWFGTDAHDAGAFVGELGVVKFLLSDLSDSARAEAEAALRATIAAHETAAGVFYESAAWLVTARRSQPAAGASGAGALR